MKIAWTLFLLGLNAAAFGGIFPPEYDWQTLRSKYFDIHFDKTLQNQAQGVAEIADRVYIKVTEEMQWKPYWRPDIVLIDNVDSANGAATPIPYNRMLILLPKLIAQMGRHTGLNTSRPDSNQG